MIALPDGPTRLVDLAANPLLALARPWSAPLAAQLLAELMARIPWTDGHYTVAGRRFALPRLQCWFADPGVAYRYADQLENSRPWTADLAALRTWVETATGATFNAVLANLYRDGADRVAWHADDDDDLGPMPVIASLSLGATRRFHWRPRPGVAGAPGSLALSPGTLLLMKAPFQRDWQHAVLPEPTIGAPRLNLTFRQVVDRPAGLA